MPASRKSARAVARAGITVVLGAALLLVSSGVGYPSDIPIATVPVGRAPNAVAVDPSSHLVYVANFYGDSVSVIDGVSDTVTATVPMPKGGAIGAVPNAVVVDPLTGRAYVANWQSHRVSVIDGTSLAPIATITVPAANSGNPRALALDPASAKLYVADYGTSQVSVIDVASNTVTKDIGVGSAPRALGMYSSPGRVRVFVANRYGDSVSVIDGASDTVTATVAVAAAPKAIAVDPATGYAYVTCAGGDEVAVIGDADSLVATVAVGDNPVGVAVDSARGRVFVANYGSHNVSVIDTGTSSVVATVVTGSNPFAVAFDSGDAKAFVTDYGSRSVTVIDSTLATTAVACDYRPYAVAVDEAASPHKAYASNWGSDTVTVIDEPAGGGGPVGSLPALAEAHAEEPSPVTVMIDPMPGDATTSISPTFAGTAASVRGGGGSPVLAVFWRLDDEARWRRAEITEGEGTSEVSWSATAGTSLGIGPHTLRVAAMDQAGAVSFSAGQDGGGVGASFGAPSAYAFAVDHVTVRHEQTDARITLGGPWTTASGLGFSWGSLAVVGAGPAEARIAFTGTAVSLVGLRGPNYGIASVSLDGGAYVPVDMYAPAYEYKAAWWTASGLSDGPHDVRVRWTAARNPSSTGSLLALDAVDVAGTLAAAPPALRRVESTDPAIGLTGEWTTATGTGFSGGSLRYAASGPSVADVSFKGTGISLLGMEGPVYGYAFVSMDGGARQLVDLYSPTFLYRSSFWQAQGLTDATHTVRVEFTGSKRAVAGGALVGLDAVDVEGTLVPVPAPWVRYEDADGRLGWVGTWTGASGMGFSGGAMRYSSDAAAQAQVAFEGTGVRVLALTGPMYGIAAVSVDGGVPVDVDLHSAGFAYRVPVFEVTGLSPGAHTLTVTYTGRRNALATGPRIDVDAVEVAGGRLVAAP